jgi:hypothetical protein
MCLLARDTSKPCLFLYYQADFPDSFSSQRVNSVKTSKVTIHKDGSMDALCAKLVDRKGIGQNFPLVFNVHSFTCSVTFL